MGNEKRRTANASVVFTLAVILWLNGGDVIGLVLLRSPDDEIRSGRGGPSPGKVQFFRDLIRGKSILVDQHKQVFLPDGLFRGFHQPFTTDVTPDFSFWLIPFYFQGAYFSLISLLGFFNGYPFLVAVIHDQHRHHVGDGTILLLRCRAQRLFQCRFDAKGQRGGLGCGHGSPRF